MNTGEVERTRKLREENDELKQRLRKLELALLNADAIEQRLNSDDKRFDQIAERFKRMEGLFGNLQSELGNQKLAIVRSLQVKYGTGPTR